LNRLCRFGALRAQFQQRAVLINRPFAHSVRIVGHKGRFAIVTDVERGMRWTRQRQAQFFCATSDVAADGEVVWSWRSDAGAKFVKTFPRLTGDGGNQAWSPGRSRISRKTIAQGRPGIFG
jgi:hypothetical protein